MLSATRGCRSWTSAKVLQTKTRRTPGLATRAVFVCGTAACDEPSTKGMRPMYSAGTAPHSSRFCWSVRPWASVKSVKTFRHSSLSSRFSAPVRARSTALASQPVSVRGGSALTLVAARRIAEARTARPDARCPSSTWRLLSRSASGAAWPGLLPSCCHEGAARTISTALPTSKQVQSLERVALRVRFGDYVLDPEARQLFRAGEELHLQPKTFELLDLLVRSRPKASASRTSATSLWRDIVVGTPASRWPWLSCGRGSATTRRSRGTSGRCTASDTPSRGRPRRAAAVLRRGRRRSRPRVLWEKRIIPLVEGENVLGRDEQATVRIDAPGVSRRHALIRVEGTGAMIEDLGSKNGTFLGRQAVVARPTPLPDGARSASAACSSSSAARPRPARP